MSEAPTVTNAHGAVIATRPARQTVDGHAEIGLAVPEPVQRGRRQQPHERRGVGGHEDVGDRVGIGRHRRSRIESEPSEPQHEAADDAGRHAVTRDRR